jgi:hypothetical protein
MRVDPKEIKKYQKLNQKLKEFTALQSELQFKNTYEPKFKNILMCSASKLVGCDAKIKINPREGKSHSYGHIEFVLTRQGIKESFGYTGEFKARFIQYSSWIAGYVSDNDVTAGLVKMLKSKVCQSDDALRLHLQAREDISKLGMEDENYAVHIKANKVFTVYGNIEEGYQDIPEQTTELVLSTHNSWSAKNLSLAEPGSVVLSPNTYRGKTYDLTTLLGISSQATFIEFLRISEEPTYTQIMDLLQEHITKCENHIKTKQAALEAITNKYGQYLVFKEL